MLNRILSAFFCVMLVSVSAMAQVSVNASGAKASGVGGSQSYSVGQIVFSSNSDGSNSLVHGVQQVYVVSVVTREADASDINLSLLAYPNPVNNYLMIKVNSDKYAVSSLKAKIVDINGKTLSIKNFSNANFQIDMSQFIPARYFLIVLQNNKELKTFKVIKN